MISYRTVAMSVLCTAIFFSLGAAQVLAKYRNFQFGMSLESVAKQIQMKVSDARTIHQRPAVMQTLQWAPLSPADLLRSIRFDFYNGELYKMVVVYDPAGTDGLTPDDVTEAISSVYGAGATPEDTVVIFASGVYEEKEKVLARWENSQYSYNLFRSRYGNVFGLVAFSKNISLTADDSIQEADRLDKLEAPGRELAQQMKQEEEKRSAREKARLVTKPKFRP